MSKQTHAPTLLQLFRKLGYEGVTLSKISQATGLGKASLYHHFPGGKAEMAEAALAEVNQWLEAKILCVLDRASSPEETCKVTPISTFESMCEEMNHFTDEGKFSCPLAVLILQQSSDELFHDLIGQAFSRWIEAIANVLITAGLNEQLARQRGEDAIIAIEGALILSHGLRDFALFQRVLNQLPQQLCQGI